MTDGTAQSSELWRVKVLTPNDHDAGDGMAERAV